MMGETEPPEAADRKVLDRRRAIREIVILGGAAGLALLGLSQLSKVWHSRFEEKPAPTSIPAPSIVNHPPIADFEYAPGYINPVEGREILFQDCSIDPERDSLMHSWYVEDSLVREEKNCSMRLPVGEHKVRLAVSDGRSTDCATKLVRVEADQCYPVKKLNIPLKGINYLLGRRFGGDSGVPPSELEMEESLEAIKNELRCNAIKLVGDYEQVMVECAKKALEKGFETIILSPRYSKKSPYEDVTIDEHVEKVIDFSKKAEELRENSDSIVLCVGEELEHGVRGIGTATTYSGRVDELYRQWEGRWEEWEKNMRPYIEQKLNLYLEKVLNGVRENFGGKVTYSPSDGTRLLVKWDELGFDIVGPMLYYSKKWDTEASVLRTIGELRKFRKPVYITEFGCFTYEGASLWGGDGWYRYQSQRYSQEEQAQSIMEHVKLFEAGKVDGIFLYAFLEKTMPDAKSAGILKDGCERYARKLGFYMYKSFVHS